MARLSRSGWLVLQRDGLPVLRGLPILVLTRPSIRRLRWWRQCITAKPKCHTTMLRVCTTGWLKGQTSNLCSNRISQQCRPNYDQHGKYGGWAETEITSRCIWELHDGYDAANQCTASLPTTTNYYLLLCFTAYDLEVICWSDDPGSSGFAVVVLISPRSTASFSNFTTCLHSYTAMYCKKVVSDTANLARWRHHSFAQWLYEKY